MPSRPIETRLSLSDQMLNSGCATHVAGIHGTPVKILTGPDVGKVFTAVLESESDLVLTTDLGEDRRAKRVLRFQDSTGIPNIGSQATVEVDGKRWSAVRNPNDGYLTTDFELKEIVPGIDT